MGGVPDRGGAQFSLDRDSLRILLDESSGKERLTLLHQLSERLQQSSLDSALGYANEALILAQDMESPSLRAESHWRLGRLLSRSGAHTEALSHLLEAKRTFEQLGDLASEAAALGSLGALYRRQSNYNTALEHFFSSLNLWEQVENVRGAANILHQIGIVNERMGQLSQAATFYERALRLSEDIRDFSDMAVNATQLGRVYGELGENEKAFELMRRALDASEHLPGKHATASILLELSALYEEKQAYDDAIMANRQALALADSMENPVLKSLSLQNIAAVSAEMGAYKEANEHLQRALWLLETTGVKQEYIKVLNRMARNFLHLDLLAEAVDAAERALDEAMAMKAYELSQQSLFILTEAYEREGDFEQALDTQKRLNAIKDSIFDREQARQIANMQARYEMDQKQQEIALLEEQQSRAELVRNVSMGGVVLIVVIGFLIYNRQRLKIKKNKAELENTQLKEQQLEKDLAYKNKQLTSHSLHLVQKNEAMKELMDNIDRLSQSRGGTLSHELQELRNLVDYSFNLDEDWEQFRLYFEEVHSGFFNILKERYPDLTPNELRLSALAKLNLSIKETATIMGITPNSVKTARYRLRKKLNMDTSENLNEFMMAVEKTASDR
ncbi:tetratricopeptide repeat protein [Fodinibius sediminis]|nr:tetratricopeptide repeat protein [Fodinibius sediminis]